MVTQGSNEAAASGDKEPPGGSPVLEGYANLAKDQRTQQLELPVEEGGCNKEIGAIAPRKYKAQNNVVTSSR